MSAKNDPITRYGEVVSPNLLLVVAAAFGVGGCWAIYKILTNDLIVSKREAVVAMVLVSILFFGTASGGVALAQVQSELIGQLQH